MSDFSDNGLQELVRQLLVRQSETRNLDYKEAISFDTSKKEKGEVLKDIIAMSNTRDGGYLLVGVEQHGGKFKPVGITSQQAKSFDPTNIGQFAKNYCSLLPVVGAQVVEIDGVELLLLRVDEFDSEPIVCTKDLHGDKNDLVLRAGSIYVRTTDARSLAIDSGESMRAFLDLAVQKRGDALLTQVRGLVGGPVIFGASDPSDAYQEEIDSAERFFVDNLIDVQNSWYFEVFPKDYDGDRQSAARLKEIRRESVVILRGWDFPHVDRVYDQIFDDGIQSLTHWERFHEAHRVYRSGLFTWRSQPHEDIDDGTENSLSIVSSIYSITEFFIFSSRYASLMVDSGDIVMRVGIAGLNGRALTSGPEMRYHQYQTAATRFNRSYSTSIEELRSSYLDLASDATRRLFDLYGFDARPELIRYWQEKLVDRRF
ncbi:AlbA family DNA-binding domain-containing protein [Nocardia abscessus]|uniref:AlbA family DNA-binding domain-containing protein n=1 Tax=Nocardia abscessus TaxID=120957 RepID=UPI0024557209|nr:ATP-binding protein [Nocardia abscessus]